MLHDSDRVNLFLEQLRDLDVEPGPEPLEQRLAQFCRDAPDPDMNAFLRKARALLAECAGRATPQSTLFTKWRRDIEEKVQEVQQLHPEPQRNKGGRQLSNDSVAWWIEIVRVALFEGQLPGRDSMRVQMDEWVSTNCPDGGPAATATREYLRRLYESPGIIP